MSQFREPLTVRRPDSAVTYVDGIGQPSSTSNVDITASVQPLRPNEMELLPEGRRDSEAFRLYTATELLPADEKTGRDADIVEYNGKDYEVLSCARWQNRVIPHFKAVVVKL